MKRGIGVLLALALVIAMASNVGAARSKLSSELLTSNQMPTGWSVIKPPSESGSGLDCLAGYMKPKGALLRSHASVVFGLWGGPPVVTETLAIYSNPKTADEKIIARLSSCKHLSGSADGVQATGTIGRQKFSKYGDASTAFSVVLNVQDSTVADFLLIVRKGDVIMALQEFDEQQYVELIPFEGFATKALVNLPT